MTRQQSDEIENLAQGIWIQTPGAIKNGAQPHHWHSLPAKQRLHWRNMARAELKKANQPPTTVQ